MSDRLAVLVQLLMEHYLPSSDGLSIDALSREPKLSELDRHIERVARGLARKKSLHENE